MEKKFDIYEDLQIAKDKFKFLARNYNKAIEMFEQVFKPIMPEHWSATFRFEDNRLLIINYSHAEEKEEAPLISFKTLCNALSAAGYNVRKSVNDLGSDYIFLDAHSEYHKDDISFTIHIRQCQVDKCEIEYQEVTEKKAVLSGFCAEVMK